MIAAIQEREDDLNALCTRFGVDRLALFGSAAGSAFDEDQSDFDFLVEFGESAIANYADSYFGLLDSLQSLFDRPIDLIVESAIRNPYFRESVAQTRVPFYGS